MSGDNRCSWFFKNFDNHAVHLTLRAGLLFETKPDGNPAPLNLDILQDFSLDDNWCLLKNEKIENYLEVSVNYFLSNYTCQVKIHVSQKKHLRQMRVQLYRKSRFWRVRKYWDLKVEKGDIYRFHVLARLLTKSTVQLDFLLAKDICLVYEIELRLAGWI